MSPDFKNDRIHEHLQTEPFQCLSEAVAPAGPCRTSSQHFTLPEKETPAVTGFYLNPRLRQLLVLEHMEQTKETNKTERKKDLPSKQTAGSTLGWQLSSDSPLKFFFLLSSGSRPADTPIRLYAI